MKTAATGLPARRWVPFALVALLGLTIAAGGTSAVASGPGHAFPAKKKCKKAKKGAVSAKKKKCKHKKLIPLPVLPAPAPLVRGTLSWPSGDVDLHAFDASGNHSGFAFGTIQQGIPDSIHSPDSLNGGSETFTDNIFVAGGPANREFSYAACFYDDANATFTGVTKDGTSGSLPINGLAGQGYTLTVAGGPPVPASFACP